MKAEMRRNRPSGPSPSSAAVTLALHPPRIPLRTLAKAFGFRWQLKVIQSRPLKDLVCIQLLHSGFQSDSYEIGEPGTPGSVVHQNYHSYQMNLVFDGGQESRYNLVSHSDWIWVRKAGQKLADFVGVPVRRWQEEPVNPEQSRYFAE